MAEIVDDKRRGRRLFLKEKEKDLMQLWRKKLRLVEAKKSWNWVELPKPERHGYQKTFVIREDVEKGFPNEIKMYTDILKMCNNVIRDGRGKQFKAYVVRDKWMFVEQVKPYYVTHRLVIDPQLDSELAELENKIQRNNLWPAFAKLMGWNWGWKDWTVQRNKALEAAISKANFDEVHSAEGIYSR